MWLASRHRPSEALWPPFPFLNLQSSVDLYLGLWLASGFYPVSTLYHCLPGTDPPPTSPTLPMSPALLPPHPLPLSLPQAWYTLLLPSRVPISPFLPAKVLVFFKPCFNVMLTSLALPCQNRLLLLCVSQQRSSMGL